MHCVICHTTKRLHDVGAANARFRGCTWCASPGAETPTCLRYDCVRCTRSHVASVDVSFAFLESANRIHILSWVSTHPEEIHHSFSYLVRSSTLERSWVCFREAKMAPMSHAAKAGFSRSRNLFRRQVRTKTTGREMKKRRNVRAFGCELVCVLIELRTEEAASWIRGSRDTHGCCRFCRRRVWFRLCAAAATAQKMHLFDARFC